MQLVCLLILIGLLDDGLATHHYVVGRLFIVCRGHALPCALNCQVSVELLLFCDLGTYVLKLLHQRFLRLLKCTQLVSFLLDVGRGNLQVAKFTDFVGTLLHVVARFNQLLLHGLPKLMIVNVSSNLFVHFVQLFDFLLHLLHLGLDHLLLLFSISRD